MDKDLGFNFTGGGYSNKLKEVANCVKQNWDGSSFLGRVDSNKRTFYGLWAYTMGTLLGKLVIPVAFPLYLCSLEESHHLSVTIGSNSTHFTIS